MTSEATLPRLLRFADFCGKAVTLSGDKSDLIQNFQKKCSKYYS